MRERVSVPVDVCVREREAVCVCIYKLVCEMKRFSINIWVREST